MNLGGFLRHNWVVIVLLASFAGWGGAVVYPAFQHEATNARRSSCQFQLKNITLACFQYQEDYGGKYPPLSDRSARGWAQILRARDASLKFSCPAGYESSYSPTSDYFFNARLATRQGSSVLDPAMTISFGDGVDNGPTNSHYWELPNDGENSNSPLRRHLDGANYGFADGHVKWLRPQWIENEAGLYAKFSPDKSASHTEQH